MKPVGAGVHFRRGTVQWPLVKWLVIGSVPAAFSGAFILDRMAGDGFEEHLKLLLGYALLVAAIAMIAKAVLQSRANRRLAALGMAADETAYTVKPIPTLLIGVAGGLIVGMTSVGSGSLMIVSLMLLYPRLSAKSLVGTDLFQAIPLVAAATLGHVFFGNIDLGLTGALLIGSLPGVYLGARFSSKAPDVVIRPALIFVLAASSLKLLGMGTTTLGVVLLLMVIVSCPLWAAVDAATRPSVQWSCTQAAHPVGVAARHRRPLRRRLHRLDLLRDDGAPAVPHDRRLVRRRGPAKRCPPRSDPDRSSGRR